MTSQLLRVLLSKASYRVTFRCGGSRGLCVPWSCYILIFEQPEQNLGYFYK